MNDHEPSMMTNPRTLGSGVQTESFLQLQNHQQAHALRGERPGRGRKFLHGGGGGAGGVGSLQRDSDSGSQYLISGDDITRIAQEAAPTESLIKEMDHIGNMERTPFMGL